MKTVIEARNISMCFNLSKDKIYSLKEYLIKLINGKLYYDEFWALKNVSFEVFQGEIFGIIGLNGAGKSTLLKIIAGVLKPTKGDITVNGVMAPLIELGAGFDMELTARENIFLNAAILGHSQRFIKDKLDDIIDFAEIEDFLDVPLKNYSSGMTARLGFSIATIIEPDILIVDEVLSVGDYKFQEKCQNRIKNLINNNTTVVFVSHSINQVEELCDRVLWLEKGTVVSIGDTKELCKVYRKS